MHCPICRTSLSGQVTKCPTCQRPFLLRDSADKAAVLQTHNLTKVYGQGHTEVVAVDKVNFQVARGEVVLVMGPSGSGKTTLLLLLGCLMRPTSGRLEFGGLDVHRLPTQKLPEFRLLEIGFVFQDFNLIDSLSALENVAVPMQIAKVRPKVVRERAVALLSELGLKERLHHEPSKLSGGEKQRVAIARALAMGPHLILADEPTANLDSKSGLAVMDNFKRLATEEGCSLIIVSHDPRLRTIADRTLWLEDGRMHEESPSEQTALLWEQGVDMARVW